MTTQTFSACVVRRSEQGEIAAAVESLPLPAPAAGEVLIRVAWSSLNYKDALAATGHPGVVSKFPQVPGIDAVGEVANSNDARYQLGDAVLVTSYDLGVNRHGGWGEYVCVPADWVLPLPQGLTAREAMIYGTAGLTAGLCVQALLQHSVTPQSGVVLVTGATGGVGSLAVRLLAQLGYRVVAVTGKSHHHALLKQWGAGEVWGREALAPASQKPLLNPRFAGVIDSVGGATLVSALKQMRNNGCVAACGLAGGAELSLTVFPFILRGVTLAGIDSAWCDYGRREQIWGHLASDWKPDNLAADVAEVDLAGVLSYVPKILRGEVTGRVIVRPS